jgi:hypothetical protein
MGPWYFFGRIERSSSAMEPFSALCAYTYDVLPVRKGVEYDVLEVSADGTRWRARDPGEFYLPTLIILEGRVGWMPAKFCDVLEGNVH